MHKNNLQLRIAYLYPDILQSFCDESNINVLCLRARARNIDVEVCNIIQYSKFQASNYDFFYIGGNNPIYLDIVLESIKDNKEELKKAQNSNIPILAINCGCYLLGRSYQLHNSKKIQALGLFDINSTVAKNRFFSNVVGVSNLKEKHTIVGFINSEMQIQLNKSAIPYLTLKKAIQEIKTEGIICKNSIGTNITSPLLAQNPNFCDYLIETALKIKYKSNINLKPLDDEIESLTHEILAAT